MKDPVLVQYISDTISFLSSRGVLPEKDDVAISVESIEISTPWARNDTGGTIQCRTINFHPSI